MAMSETFAPVSANLPSHMLLASLSASLLPQLRETLAPLRPFSVFVCAATRWGTGSELSYRGQRVRVDAQVARVEITCAEPRVEAIMKALNPLLARPAGEHSPVGTLLVFPLSYVVAPSAPAIEVTR